jgi:hypothetical protein
MPTTKFQLLAASASSSGGAAVVGQPAPSTQHPAPSTQHPAPKTQHKFANWYTAKREKKQTMKYE